MQGVTWCHTVGWSTVAKIVKVSGSAESRSTSALWLSGIPVRLLYSYPMVSALSRVCKDTKDLELECSLQCLLKKETFLTLLAEF